MKLKTGRHTSALKANRKSVKNRWANMSKKDSVKDITKELLAAITAKDAAKAKEVLPKVMSAWTRLGSSNVVHHATASRKIGRLSAAVQKLSSAK